MAKYFVKSELSENISETPEGFLLCRNVPITRTGELKYGRGETPLEVGDDGYIHMERTSEDVFDEATIASFEGKPVTIGHPEDFVTPKNWKDLTVGTLHNVRPGSGENANLLLSDIIISDERGISLVKNGLREVSCGYEAEFTQTGKGRGRQTNIIGNHVALVDKGRAGSSCAIIDNHNGVYNMSTLKDKIMSKLGFVVDEAISEEKAAAKAKKENDAKTKDAKAKDDKSKKESSEVLDAIKALNERFDNLEKQVKAKDENNEEEQEEEEIENDENEGESDGENQNDGDDNEEESEDEKAKKAKAKKAKAGTGDKKADPIMVFLSKLADKLGVDMDEDEEDDEKDYSDRGGKIVGDSAARAEILAPGIDLETKNLKVEALKQALKTKDGKKVIDSLTGGKAIDYKDADKVNTIFVGASEILKAQRGDKLAATKTGDHKTADDGEMTPEKLNEKYAKHWGRAA